MRVERDLRIKRERSLKDMCDVKAEGGIVGEQMGPAGEEEMGNQPWEEDSQEISKNNERNHTQTLLLYTNFK